MYRYLITVVIVMFAAAIFLGCEQCDNIEQQNKAIITGMTEAMNSQNLDAFDEYFAENFTRHCQATPEVQIKSLEEMKEFCELWYVVFPDAKMIPKKIVAEGDLVAFWGTFVGTHEAPMGPYPATGRRMESETFGIFRIEEGKIAELWVTWDNVAMFHQLGLDPPPAPLSETQEEQTE